MTPVPHWMEMLKTQQVFKPLGDVESVWRKYGWVKPSTEDQPVMQKQAAYRHFAYRAEA